MKKHEVFAQSSVDSLLYQLLEITDEAKQLLLEKNIENFEKIIYIRGELLNKLLSYFERKELTFDQIKLLKTIERETNDLINKGNKLKEEIFNNLISLYNGKKVVKYH